jgi:hypothetical protein
MTKDNSELVSLAGLWITLIASILLLLQQFSSAGLI